MPATMQAIGATRSAAAAPDQPLTHAKRARAWLGPLAHLFTPAPPEGCRCRNPFSEVDDGAEEVVLDVRGLSLTGQSGRTLERMEVLPEGARLRHVNTLVPWPLLAMLEARGYRYRLVGRREGAVHVVIWGAAPAR